MKIGKSFAAFALAIAAVWCGKAFAADRYLMVAPNDLYDSLAWYVDQRAAAHPEIEFDIVNAKTIYETYPVGSSGVRNDAEAIHKYLRNYYKSHSNLKYVVLGGCWYDAQNFRKWADPSVYFRDGTLVSRENAIPGVMCPYLTSYGGNYITDLFYACLDEKCTYPWDYDGDGQYMGEEECRKEYVDTTPDVAVSRLSFVPRPEFTDDDGVMLNQHQMITNFVLKLQRVEGAAYTGAGKIGAAAEWIEVNGGYANTQNWNMDRSEFEFYDFAPNMGDPRSAVKHGDLEKESRQVVRNIAATHPVLQGKTLNQSVKTVRRLDAGANATADFFNSDLDYGWMYSHGWAKGASYFSVANFTSYSGIMKFANVAVPCESGMVDYYETVNGKRTMNWCLGNCGLGNPNGGFIASVNNTRMGVYGERAGLGLKRRIDKFYGQQHETVGMAWLHAIQEQKTAYFKSEPWNINRNYAIAILHGDPLMKIADDADASITDANWNAPRIVKAATLAVEEITLTNSVAMMTAATAGGAIGGAYDFRVMKSLTVSGAKDLVISAPGGVASDGVCFTAGNHARTLTLAADDYFYLAAVSNATALTLAGNAAVVETENIDATALDLRGTSAARRDGEANILRGRTTGSLARFGALDLTDTAVELQTWKSGFTLGTLTNATLTVGQNPYWGNSGYGETLTGAFTMNDATLAVKTTKEFTLEAATIAAGGATNRFASSSSGYFNLVGTTTVTLDGSTLVLDAEFKNADNGKLVINGTGYLVFGSGAAIGVPIELGTNISFPDRYFVKKSSDQVEIFGDSIKYFMMNYDGGETTVLVDGNRTLSVCIFGNTTTKYTFSVLGYSSKTASLTLPATSLVGETQFDIPLTVNGSLLISGAFIGDSLTCSGEVIVEAGGAFALQGSHKMALTLRDGACLRAVAGEALDWNANTSIEWEGEVIIDADALTLTDEPVTILSGVNCALTVQDIADFKVKDNRGLLRIGENGELQLIAYSPDAPDWTADVVIDVDGADEWLVDSATRARSVTFKSDNSFTLRGVDGGYYDLTELNLASVTNTATAENTVTIADLEVRGGVVRAAESTVIASNVTATVAVKTGDTLIIEDPTVNTLTFDSASQGCVYVRDTKLQAYRVKLFDYTPLDNIGGFEVVAIDADGNVNNLIEIVYEDGAYYSRPLGGLIATAVSGARFTELAWQNSGGVIVEVADWSKVDEAELKLAGDATVAFDAAPAKTLDFSGSGTLTATAADDSAAVLPRSLVITGAVVRVAADILPQLESVIGTGTLKLATGARTRVPMSAAKCPADALTGGIVVEHGSTLALVFSSDLNLWSSTGWSALTGDGTIAFDPAASTKHVVYPPQSGWASTLSFECNEYLTYEYTLSAATTYTLRNFSGSGRIGMKHSSTTYNYKYFDTFKFVQTAKSEWTGNCDYSDWSSSSKYGTDFYLLVSGSGDIEKRLVYSGTCNTGSAPGAGMTYVHQMTVDSTGVLELNGTWRGTIVNNGLMIVGAAAKIVGGNLNGTVTTLDAGTLDLTKFTLGTVTIAGDYPITVKAKVSSVYTEAQVCYIDKIPAANTVKLVVTDDDGKESFRYLTADDLEAGYTQGYALMWRPLVAKRAIKLMVK